MADDTPPMLSQNDRFNFCGLSDRVDHAWLLDVLDGGYGKTIVILTHAQMLENVPQDFGPRGFRLAGTGVTEISGWKRTSLEYCRRRSGGFCFRGAANAKTVIVAPTGPRQPWEGANQLFRMGLI
jgi:hypothetical protein